MINILCLETSTSVCSVCLTGDEKILSSRLSHDAKSHASQLNPFISEVLKESDIQVGSVSAIAVSKGPGSYTGLRIGVSTAKGIAFALKIPMISVDTLFLMASGFLERNPELAGDEKSLLCPMIDARRMEVYNSVYKSDLSLLQDVKAEIITENSFNELLKNHKVHFFGDGAMKCSNLIKNNNAFFHEGFYPFANFMGKKAFELYNERIFENLAYFEPFYLKDFVTTVPVNKMTQG